MSEGLRKALRIAGMTLIAAALCAIGYALYNIISTEITTKQGLEDVEQMLQDLESFTGHPAESALPTATAEAGGGQAPASATPGGSETSGSPTAEVTPDPTGAPSSAGPGDPEKKPLYLGKLVFESLGRSVAVREGITKADLAAGAAHHPRSSPAGAVGNCVIYGHRNTVFRGFDKLKDGDAIRLEVPGNTYTYRIKSMAVVEPDDPKIFQSYGQKVMTLVTCYPFRYVGSAPQRYIVVCVMD